MARRVAVPGGTGGTLAPARLRGELRACKAAARAARAGGGILARPSAAAWPAGECSGWAVLAGKPPSASRGSKTGEGR